MAQVVIKTKGQPLTEADFDSDPKVGESDKRYSDRTKAVFAHIAQRVTAQREEAEK